MNFLVAFCLLAVASAEVCRDLVNPRTGVSDCPFRANLCKDPVYKEVMTRQCAKTCGFCTTGTSTGNSPACVDKVNSSTGRSNCAENAYMCNDSVYYKLMTEQCPRTCGRC